MNLMFIISNFFILFIFNNTVFALDLPFAQHEKWVICQGYFGIASGTHNDSYALDLVFLEGTIGEHCGPNGCNNLSASANREILSPGRGKVISIVNDIIILKLDDFSHNVEIGHGDWNVEKNDNISKGQALGNVRASLSPHIHIACDEAKKYTLNDFFFPYVPDILSSDGTINQWSKTVLSYTNLSPFLSFEKNPNQNQYSVYGFKQHPIYSSFKINLNYNKNVLGMGILAKKGPRNSPTDISLENGKWLSKTWVHDNYLDPSEVGINLGPNTVGVSTPVTGSYVYDSGEYLFIGFIAENKDLNYKGFPITFSIINQNELIVDNDQSEQQPREAIKQTEFRKSYSLNDDNVTSVPGYYLCAHLINGRSNALAKWKPMRRGKFKIKVFIPQASNLTKEVLYRLVKYDENNKESKIVFDPVDQTNTGWNELSIDNGTNTIFYLNKDDYIHLKLNNTNEDWDGNMNSNFKIDKNHFAIIDAIKISGINEDIEIIENWFSISENQAKKIYRNFMEESHDQIDDIIVNHDNNKSTYTKGNAQIIISWEDGSIETLGTPSAKKNIYTKPAQERIENNLYGAGSTRSIEFYIDFKEGKFSPNSVELNRRKRNNHEDLQLPDTLATRSETLLLSMLVHGDTIQEGLNSSYVDVATTYPLFDYIETATILGIVMGYVDENNIPTNEFKPDNTISRIETLKILFKTFQLDLLENNEKGPRGRIWSDSLYSDIDKAHWSYKYIRAAYLYEIMDGYGNGKFGPDDQITRSQVVKIVHQAMQLSNDSFITSGHYVEPETEIYTENENTAPTGSIVTTKLNDETYKLKANFTDSEGHKLSYYWIADEGKFENISSDETEVDWISPIKSSNSTFLIELWVHDGHGLLSMTKILINSKEDILTNVIQILKFLSGHTTNDDLLLTMDVNRDNIINLKDIITAITFESSKIDSDYQKTYTNDFGMSFVLIKPGEFLMGSPEDETGRFSEEVQHRVIITQAFYLQTTEVTKGQWKSVMGSDPSYFSSLGDDYPVEQVSWEDTQAFIKKLNLHENTIGYRLPSEAEWEYAARSGSTTAFANGNLSEAGCVFDTNLNAIGWYCKNYGYTKIHSVAQKQANAWGLYDMHGNVLEWCQDWYDSYPNTSVTDPVGPSSGTTKVLRGGCWFFDAHKCRSAFRYSSSPRSRGGVIGLRLLKTLNH